MSFNLKIITGWPVLRAGGKHYQAYCYLRVGMRLHGTVFFPFLSCAYVLYSSIFFLSKKCLQVIVPVQ